MDNALNKDSQPTLLGSYSDTVEDCRGCALGVLCRHPINTEQKSKRADCALTRNQLFNKGDYLFHQGEPFESIYIIRSGSIKIYVLTGDGQEQVTNFQFSGEVLGFSGLSTGTYSVSAVAMETTSICKISFADLEELSLNSSVLRQDIYSIMGRELQQFETMIMTLSKKTSEERVAGFLLKISDHYEQQGYSATCFRLPMSRNEIGNFLGLAVETISRVFSKLQKRSLIQVNGKEIELLDREHLRTISGES